MILIFKTFLSESNLFRFLGNLIRILLQKAYLKLKPNCGALIKKKGNIRLVEPKYFEFRVSLSNCVACELESYMYNIDRGEVCQPLCKSPGPALTAKQAITIIESLDCPIPELFLLKTLSEKSSKCHPFAAEVADAQRIWNMKSFSKMDANLQGKLFILPCRNMNDHCP